MTSPAICTNNELLASIELYQTTADQQQEALQQLRNLSPTLLGKGCQSAVLHRSLDRLRIMLYRQWLNEDVYRQATTAGPSLAHRNLSFVDGNLYRVVVSQPTGADLSLRTGRLLHLGEFHLLPDKTEHLIDEERRIAPIALQHPDLLSVNFHRSLDATRTMNYGFWQRIDRFSWLLEQPRFEPIRTYWRPYAEVAGPGAEYNEFHLYEIDYVVT